ncbi:sensor histidine kinase [Georgenia sp. AZ-5]|uniref:sensor histidine kinase n=1 Tax=Georgenia sp. AZ-5 TaxID=3367526 RepID=UPI0037547209
MHDAVAHAMSVIAVQAGMGHHVIDTQPAEAKRALAAIETTTRIALVEMRRMLGVLRDEGEPDASLGPGHGVDDVPDLIAAAGDGGVTATLAIRGTPRELPAGVDVSVYRIVQEALTNTIKHGGRTARVVLDFSGDELRVEVTDDGARPAGDGARSAEQDAAPARDGAAPAGDGAPVPAGAPPAAVANGARAGAGTTPRPPATTAHVPGSADPRLGAAVRHVGSGQGLIGMRERVAVLGGELFAGPVPGGGFRVLARVPLGVSAR